MWYFSASKKSKRSDRRSSSGNTGVVGERIAGAGSAGTRRGDGRCAGRICCGTSKPSLSADGRSREWGSLGTGPADVPVVASSPRGAVGPPDLPARCRPVRQEVERRRKRAKRVGCPRRKGPCRELFQLRQALWTFVRRESGWSPRATPLSGRFGQGSSGAREAFGARGAEEGFRRCRSDGRGGGRA